MAFSNKLTSLLNKIERRLGCRGLNLPPELGKDEWVGIIKDDTLPTFSRYFPHKMEIVLTEENRSRVDPRVYIIDENQVPGDIEIIGVRDVSWESLANNPSTQYTTYGVYGAYDGYNCASFEDFSLLQMQADASSLFNAGIYLDFESPNKVRLKGSINQDFGAMLRRIPIEVFLMHPLNLQTIEPTKMEFFEKLAIADVATFLDGELKYYDNLPIIFGGQVELHLEKIQEAAESRSMIVDALEEHYVSAANKNQPLMFSTV